MVGTPLIELRTRIESLASDDGHYYIICGRTGERPIPVMHARFGSRDVAQDALEAATQYRNELRRYDPRVPDYDLIVCEETTQQNSQTAMSVPAPEGDPDRHCRIEFCHQVAAAVFETLSESSHDDIETAIIDAYFTLAETVDDPDDLCLCLLETVARECDARLTPSEQATVLARAADQFPPTDHSKKPVVTALTRLQRRGILTDFTCRPAAIDPFGGSRSVSVTLSEYALSPRDGRLPVLPVIVEIYRHQPAWSPTAVYVTDTTDGWRITIDFGPETTPAGLSNAAIRSQN
jgi:hypothetical protein